MLCDRYKKTVEKYFLDLVSTRNTIITWCRRAAEIGSTRGAEKSAKGFLFLPDISLVRESHSLHACRCSRGSAGVHGCVRHHDADDLHFPCFRFARTLLQI